MLSERMGDELLLYDSQTHTAHCLSRVAADVWSLCDGTRAAEDMARELDVSVEQVRRALEELTGAGLLEISPFPAGGVSRREVARQFAKVGVAALSAPLIYSVAVPAAAAAASDLCAGKVCNDNNACTTDDCDPVTGECIFTPINCNDNNPCTTDSCDVVTGCYHTPVPNGSPCPSGLCNGAGVCVPNP
jgi:hypothetical protein